MNRIALSELPPRTNDRDPLWQELLRSRAQEAGYCQTIVAVVDMLDRYPDILGIQECQLVLQNALVAYGQLAPMQPKSDSQELSIDVELPKGFQAQP